LPKHDKRSRSCSCSDILLENIGIRECIERFRQPSRPPSLQLSHSLGWVISGLPWRQGWHSQARGYSMGQSSWRSSTTRRSAWRRSTASSIPPPRSSCASAPRLRKPRRAP